MITTEQAIALARECGFGYSTAGNCFIAAKEELTALCNLAYAKGVEDAGKGQEPVAMNGFNGLVESCERNRFKRDIKTAVDKFLRWKLPKDFCPDAGIKYSAAYEYDSPYWPIGTNLLTAPQAAAMFEHCLEGTGYVVHHANDQLRTDNAALMGAIAEMMEHQPRRGQRHDEIKQEFVDAYAKLTGVYIAIQGRGE